jgi:hypothetical protein
MQEKEGLAVVTLCGVAKDYTCLNLSTAELVSYVNLYLSVSENVGLRQMCIELRLEMKLLNSDQKRGEFFFFNF